MVPHQFLMIAGLKVYTEQPIAKHKVYQQTTCVRLATGMVNTAINTKKVLLSSMKTDLLKSMATLKTFINQKKYVD